MSRYLYILEETETGFSAYVPDRPGCVATGETQEEVAENMREAIEFHLEGMRVEGYPVPQPSSAAAYAEIQTAASFSGFLHVVSQAVQILADEAADSLS